jgi:hypothetical protein
MRERWVQMSHRKADKNLHGKSQIKSTKKSLWATMSKVNKKHAKTLAKLAE